MSTYAMPHVSPSSAVMQYHSSTARFASTTHHSGAVVVEAHGELDATNADCYVNYTLRHVNEDRPLVLDLSSLDFCGTEGFLAVLKIRCYCKHHGVEWSLVSGEAVDRLLEIGDADCGLPTAGSLTEALQSGPLAAHAV
jgi:anti-anti-sigma factor